MKRCHPYNFVHNFFKLFASFSNIYYLFDFLLFSKVISILLEKYSLPELAEKIVFIAGHKVTNDPVAIPFSMVSTADICYILFHLKCIFIFNAFLILSRLYSVMLFSFLLFYVAFLCY
jgi:hypothetical protein